MPTYADLEMAPPTSWDEFESIVCSAAKNRWKVADFVRHGRQGQRQNGVDVYGKDDNGNLVGLQCKNTWSRLSEDTIRDEIKKAELFKPALTRLYIATTANTDRTIQQFVRDVSKLRATEGGFEVVVLFWHDIWQDLTLDESRLFQHYPQLKPKNQPTIEPSHDLRLFQEFQTTLGYEPAVHLIRDQDFGNSFSRKAIQPLFDFVEKWDRPEKEFLDPELEAALADLYRVAKNLSTLLEEKVVPVGHSCELLSVYSDNLRAMGPRPVWVREDAIALNERALLFLPTYEKFLRLCRNKLLR